MAPKRSGPGAGTAGDEENPAPPGDEAPSSFPDSDADARQPLLGHCASMPPTSTRPQLGRRTRQALAALQEGDEGDMAARIDALRRADTALSFSSRLPALRTVSEVSTGSGAGNLWREKVDDIITLNRLVSARYQPGREPGVDVKRYDYTSVYAHLHTAASITCVDYSAGNERIEDKLDNSSLESFLQKPRPPWSKVRWIIVEGLSWDVITALARAYDLHPLAVEDIVHPMESHVPQRIKADFYPGSVFTSMILVSVGSPSCLHSPDAAAPCPISEPDSPSAAWGQHAGQGLARFKTRLLRPNNHVQPRRKGAGAKLDDGALYMPMELVVEQASLFLLKDGTVLSLFQTDADRISKPILERIKGRKTLLTESEDASFLFNGIVDAIVDHAMPVVQIYASKIAALESRVLVETRPKAVYTKELHLLSNDLNVLRRALVPTQHLVHKLQTGGGTSGSDNAAFCSSQAGAALITQLTRVYLGDVLDHISTIVEDMTTLQEQAKDLIDLIFNTTSHQQNVSMQILTIIQAVFLPLSFLAGVYGTNFVDFPEVHWKYGYVYFWLLCCFSGIMFLALLKRWGLFAGFSG